MRSQSKNRLLSRAVSTEVRRLRRKVASLRPSTGGSFIFEPLDPRILLSSSVSGTAYINDTVNSVQRPCSGLTVYADINSDGSLDPGDVSGTTASDGTYTLSGLSAGTYNIIAVQPDGYSTSLQSVSPDGSTNLSGVDFTYSPPLSNLWTTRSSSNPTSEIDLTWTLDSTFTNGSTSIELQRSDGSTTTTFDLGSSSTSWNDTGLVPNTNYSYTIWMTGLGFDAGSISGGASTDAIPAPLAPSPSPDATSKTSQIDVTIPNYFESGTTLDLHRSGGSGGDADLGTVSANSSYPDSGLDENTTYTYWLIANASGYSSDASGSASATTFPAPSVLTVTVGSDNDHVHLLWTTPSSATNVTVQATAATSGTNDGDWWVGDGSDVHFYVATIGSTGEESDSNTADYITAVTPPNNDLSISVDPSSPTDTVIGTFTYDSMQPLTLNGAAFTPTNTGGDSYSFTVGGLSGATSNTFTLSNAGGSVSASVYTAQLAPASITTTYVSQTEIDLAWTNVGDGTGATVTGASGLTGVGTNSCSLGGLEPDTTYTIQLIGTGPGPDSAPSSPLTITTTPLPPAGLTVDDATQHELHLTWANPNPHPHSITIYGGTTDDPSTFTSMGSFDSSTFDGWITGLDCGTTYYLDATFDSYFDTSEEASGTTLPCETPTPTPTPEAPPCTCNGNDNPSTGEGNTPEPAPPLPMIPDLTGGLGGAPGISPIIAGGSSGAGGSGIGGGAYSPTAGLAGGGSMLQGIPSLTQAGTSIVAVDGPTQVSYFEGSSMTEAFGGTDVLVTQY